MARKKKPSGLITYEFDSVGNIVVSETGSGDTLYVQTDWDYPGIATTFGWDKTDTCGHDLEFDDDDDEDDDDEDDDDEVDDDEGECCICKHDQTDGSVDCICGLKASDFISAAYDFLVENEGAEAKDPGYFS